MTAPRRDRDLEPPRDLRAVNIQLYQTAYGRVLKLLNVADESTRESLPALVERRVGAETVQTLEREATQRGASAHLRCDNSPEPTRPRYAIGAGFRPPRRRSSSAAPTR